MPRQATALVVSEGQRSQIEQWLAAVGTRQQVALRCRIVLAAGRGESEAAIAFALEINRKTVRYGVSASPKGGCRVYGRLPPGEAAKRRMERSDQGGSGCHFAI
jgi:hypothetical protein